MDPYVYPGTSVLINKLDIRNSEKLSIVEARFFTLRSQEPLPIGNFDYDHLKAIHYHFFSDIYDWAGQERAVNIGKAESYFAHTAYISSELNKLFSRLKQDNYLREISLETFSEKLSYYFNEMNAAHPFREGNGRTQRAFCDVIVEQAGYVLDWKRISHADYLNASIAGFMQGDYAVMAGHFKEMTCPINRTKDLKLEPVKLTPETIQRLKMYVEKQVELTQFVHQKNQFLVSDSKLFHEFAQQATALNQHIKELAKELVIDQSVQALLKQPTFISLHQQGGFAAIHERFQQNDIIAEDVLTVLRYAKGNLQSLSQSSNQKQESNRSGRHR